MSTMLLKAAAWLAEKRLEAARDEGQGTIEYVLVLGVIVVGIFTLVAWTSLGAQITAALGDVSELFTGANPINPGA